MNFVVISVVNIWLRLKSKEFFDMIALIKVINRLSTGWYI